MCFKIWFANLSGFLKSANHKTSQKNTKAEVSEKCKKKCFTYIVGSRGASQLGGTFEGTLQGIRLISYSFTKLPSWYNKNTCLMLIKHSLFLEKI